MRCFLSPDQFMSVFNWAYLFKIKVHFLPNNTNFLLSKPWKFQFISCSRLKVISFLLPDRHTFCIPICTSKIFFYMEIYTFYYTLFLCSLCSLTHFVCEGSTTTTCIVRQESNILGFSKLLKIELPKTIFTCSSIFEPIFRRFRFQRIL